MQHARHSHHFLGQLL